MEHFKVCMSKYATFQGRARRSEFWFFQLFVLIISFGIQIAGIILTAITGSEVIVSVFSIASIIFSLAILLPSISVTVRRLHDTDRSGWFYWISLIPLVGFILLLIWLCTEGNQGDNRFGSDPKQK